MDDTRSPVLQFRMPQPLNAAIAAAAKATGQNTSEILRELIKEALTTRGYWPPNKQRSE